MHNLFLIDDRPVMRIGLRTIIEGADIPIAEFCCVGSAAAHLLFSQQPGASIVVGIADLSDPAMSMLREVGRQSSCAGVLAITSLSEVRYGLELMRAGALGVVSDTAAPETIVEAVMRTLMGRRFVGADLAEALVDRFIGPSVDRVAPPFSPIPLRDAARSEIQLEVVRKIAMGWNTARISEALNLAENEVLAHRVDVLQRAMLIDDSDLAQHAFAQGLVDDRRRG